MDCPLDGSRAKNWIRAKSGTDVVLQPVFPWKSLVSVNYTVSHAGQTICQCSFWWVAGVTAINVAGVVFAHQHKTGNEWFCTLSRVYRDYYICLFPQMVADTVRSASPLQANPPFFCLGPNISFLFVLFWLGAQVVKTKQNKKKNSKQLQPQNSTQNYLNPEKREKPSLLYTLIQLGTWVIKHTWTTSERCHLTQWLHWWIKSIGAFIGRYKSQE